MGGCEANACRGNTRLRSLHCSMPASATPGVLGDNQLKVLSDDQTMGKKRKRAKGCVETRKLGWLVTISKDNTPDLFRHEGLETLDKLKA